ncbi:MAG: SurA N-terminal domain-containing protein [Gammaproteobacteria bacterium]|nr:SurA N-terminal domain-containing protein [Gammaproteobacteria bacterium]
MLEQIRKHTHGWVAWLFLFCIAVVFIFWGAIGLRLDVGKYVEVNGKKLYPGQIEAFRQIYPRADLVQITLGIQQLQKVGFYISDLQLENLIKSMPDFQINGQFSPELYNRLYKTSPLQLEMIRLGAHYNSLIEQMSFAMQQAHADFPSSVALYFKLMDQKRTISALRVENNKFSDDISITNEDIKKYYNIHKNNFVEPAKAKLEYIKISYPELVKSVQPSQQDIEDFYKNNIDQFTLAGRKKIAQIVINKSSSQEAKEKLAIISNALQSDPNSFGDLAEKYSDDILTAKQQGEAGWFQSGDMNDKNLDQALAKLSTKNQITPPVNKGEQIYIFKLIDHESTKQLPLSKVTTEVAAKVAEEKANSLYSELKEQLERKSFENADSLDVVAEELNLKINKTDWVTDPKNKNDISSLSNPSGKEFEKNSRILSTAFSEDVLENRNNSGLIEVGPDTAAVIRIAEFQPDRIKTLEEVKPQLNTLVKNIKAKEKARDIAAKFWREFANDGNNFDKLETLSKNNTYTKYHKPIEISYIDTFWDNKTANSSEYTKEELKEAFYLPKPNNEHPVQAILLQLDNGDQSILAINKVTLGDYKSASSEQKAQAANQLKYFMIMSDNVNFFSRIQKESEIKSYM